MSQLLVKRAKVEIQRESKIRSIISRMYPTPYEQRRSMVGVVHYRTFRWLRYVPFLLMPVAFVGFVYQCRNLPYENELTPLHLWLADHGVFRHDTIKALNPAYEDERLRHEHNSKEVKWRISSTDLLSDRQVFEFAAIQASYKNKKRDSM